LKATKVDGVYSADPLIEPNATKFDQLTYDDVLEKQLDVMDLTAICLARDHSMPLRVFAMTRNGALRNAIVNDNEGTLIKS
jgi:uridylate kinase